MFSRGDGLVDLEVTVWAEIMGIECRNRVELGEEHSSDLSAPEILGKWWEKECLQWKRIYSGKVRSHFR